MQEANIIYAAHASNDYGIHGTTSSLSYVVGGGNGPTVYEPGVAGVSLVTYDLADVAEEADEIKAEKEKNKNNTTVINQDQSDQDGAEASNDNGDVVIPDYDTGELGDDQVTEAEEE